MRRIFELLLTLLLIFATQCVAKTSGNLTVSVTPPNPVLTPKGNSVHFGGRTVTPPFFSIQQLRLSYAGEGRINIYSVEVVFKDRSGGEYTCAMAGDEFEAVFSTSIDARGQVIISQGGAVQSNGFICSGAIPLPTPLPETFSLPMTVRVQAMKIDSNDIPTGRVRGEAAITVQ